MNRKNTKFLINMVKLNSNHKYYTTSDIGLLLGA
jgi:hypothetical protein